MCIDLGLLVTDRIVIKKHNIQNYKLQTVNTYPNNITIGQLCYKTQNLMLLKNTKYICIYT